MSNIFWCEFIEAYKSFPELWKVKSDAYKNKALKQNSYEELLEKYKEYDKHATLDVLKRKINNIRASYRRELKKITYSERYGCGDVYTPTLWYFSNLDFLRDQVANEAGAAVDEDISNISFEEEQIPNKRSRKNEADLRSTPVATKAYQQLEECSMFEIDEESSYSSTWKHLFRKLREDQKLHANRLIMDVLFRGASGRLDEDVHIGAQNLQSSCTLSPALTDSRSLSSSQIQRISVAPNRTQPYKLRAQRVKPRCIQQCFKSSASPLTDNRYTLVQNSLPQSQSKLDKPDDFEVYEELEEDGTIEYNDTRDVLLDYESS